MSSPRASLWKIRRNREQNEPTGNAEARSGFFIPLPTSSPAMGVLIVILVGAAVLIWQVWPKDPAGDSAEAGFLRDMYSHHSQAVALGMIIRDRTEDQNLEALATDIALTQSTQMGTMLGYLDLWGVPQGSTDLPMTWMGHPTDGLMPGMATAEEINQVRILPTAEAEMLFLNLMIRHHQGGVEMAEAYLERGNQDEVTLMADRIVLLQDSEIGTMNAMLEQRGQPPITDPLPDSHDEH